MHGLINRSIQCFLRDTYGAPVWARIVREAGLGFDSFETMLTYDAALTDAVLQAAAHVLGKPRDYVLEDLGTYLVTHENTQAVRRLLRFGGVSFADFLHSLEDLPGRARLALPDIELPLLDLQDHSPRDFTLVCRSPLAGVGHVVVGLLRAMADDYGVLSVVEHQGSCPGGEIIAVTLAETAFAKGRRFALARDGQGHA
ncbi:MAG TPA: heme NO-binding protein [Gemmobacter sp.]|nr:MAG: heme NO-binding protein [Rhodobacteraceae bacterium GWF1_65_7]HBU15100.1 heme NO-binding protein [Gemmobacter sp.]